ncbi:MAG: hypothetical protein EBW12_08175 [Actinobacteria bacterium]|nr:hypothetical protein [Actinomycetota bacterium]
MGMYDESWCSSCGCSQPYSPDEVTCGACATEQSDMQSNKLIEYMKIHRISLQQDIEKLADQMDALDPNCKDFAYLDIEYNFTSGQLSATTHLLSVAADIMGIQLEEK